MLEGSQHFRDNIGSFRRVRTPDMPTSSLSQKAVIRPEGNHEKMQVLESQQLSGRALFVKNQYRTEAGQSFIYHKPLQNQPLSHERDRMPRGKNSARGEFVHWIDKTTAKGVKLSRDPQP
jgi:hypothetical protein